MPRYLKLELTRKNIPIRTVKTVKVVVNPQKQVNLTKIRATKAPTPTPQPPPVYINRTPSEKTPTKARNVALKHKYIRPKTLTQTIGGEISSDSTQKIKRLKGVGANRILIIVGNGPSIVEAPLEHLRGHPIIDTMSINKPDNRLWQTTYWSFFDRSQYLRHEQLWSEYKGILINSTGIKQQKANSLQIKSKGGKGFSRNMTEGINIGRSSVYASMQTAYWMGYDKIFMFGVDMNPNGINGKLHFYGTNPDVDPEIRKTKFAGEAEYYDNAAEILSEEERKKYYFCSAYLEWPFAEKYNKLDHREAVDFILSEANR